MKKGFTLIELVMVISVILIIISFSSFTFANSKTYRAKEEIRKIKKDIEFTRNLAMSNREDAHFLINNDFYEIKCKDIYEKRKIRYIKFLNNKSNISDISFTRNGSTKFDGSGTLVFEINNKNYYITIEPITGRVNLKDES